MNRLPQDIYDSIGASLQGPGFDLPALATVSRQWQTAIERQTFRILRLRSTDLNRFQEIVQGSRRRYVKEIEYLIILPPYSDEERCRFEREDTRRANDEVFTAAIHYLFHLLKRWDAYKDGSIELCLRDVYSSTDHPFLRTSSPPSDVNLYGFRRDEADTRTIDLWRWRFRYSYLSLLHAAELPVVPVVRCLRIGHLTRNIYDRVPIDMAAKLPSLREGRWLMNNWEIRYIALRRTHRLDLAQAVTQVLPRLSSLQSLTLNMVSPCYWAPAFSTGTLNSGDGDSDTLSDAIRIATGGLSTLRDLWIGGTIDESLFWPGPACAFPEPYWQNVESLRVIFSTRRSCGGSYFRGCSFRNLPRRTIDIPSEAEVPPGYGDSEEEDAEAAMHFVPREHVDPDNWTVQVAPDDDALVPLIEAFGRACLQMPRLKLAQLLTRIPVPAQLDTGTCVRAMALWGVRYLSPGTLPRGDKENMDPALFDDIHQRRLFWDVMDWRPDPDLRRLLGGIGSDKYGTDLVERFVDTWKTVGRDRFLQRQMQSRS